MAVITAFLILVAVVVEVSRTQARLVLVAVVVLVSLLFDTRQAALPPLAAPLPQAAVIPSTRLPHLDDLR